MKLTATILALHLPSLGLASVYNNWAFSNAPSSGLSDITFPISMKGAPCKSGYYFAQQFNFHGIDRVGNCHSGADGGSGVSCALDILGDYSHLYTITVENTGGTTWRGTLLDTVTGQSHIIGDWTLPSSAGKMLNGQAGFVEYYNWNDGTTNHDCSTQPFTQVFFGNPTSKTKGASSGKITSVYEAGECVMKLNLKATQTGKGYQIQAGFK